MSDIYWYIYHKYQCPMVYLLDYTFYDVEGIFNKHHISTKSLHIKVTAGLDKYGNNYSFFSSCCFWLPWWRASLHPTLDTDTVDTAATTVDTSVDTVDTATV